MPVQFFKLMLESAHYSDVDLHVVMTKNCSNSDNLSPPAVHPHHMKLGDFNFPSHYPEHGCSFTSPSHDDPAGFELVTFRSEV